MAADDGPGRRARFNWRRVVRHRQLSRQLSEILGLRGYPDVRELYAAPPSRGSELVTTVASSEQDDAPVGERDD